MVRIALALALALTGFAAAAATDERLSAAIGKRLFARVWVTGPSSTLANDGLGPLFNARSCLSCHQGLDRMPIVIGADGEVTSPQHVVRLSGPDGAPDPVYGAQFQTSAVPGHTPEGRVIFDKGRFKPALLTHGAMAATTRAGARDAPMMRGLGLLDDVPDEAILALEDPDDRDGDGVRGRARRLPNGRIGRFGWRASAATLEDQISDAFHLDLGMSTARHPRPGGDCTAAQAWCRQGASLADKGTPEIAPEIVKMLADYLASLDAPNAVPSIDAEDLFASVGCAACHRPELPTRAGAPARAFTNLLLHDLGPALDGGATDPGVVSTLWRTAPLWGLSRSLRRGAGLMHDGRAGTVEEAIALHGGEGARARARFTALPPADRQRLIDYVGGL